MAEDATDSREWPYDVYILIARESVSVNRGIVKYTDNAEDRRLTGGDIRVFDVRKTLNSNWRPIHKQ